MNSVSSLFLRILFFFSFRVQVQRPCAVSIEVSGSGELVSRSYPVGGKFYFSMIFPIGFINRFSFYNNVRSKDGLKPDLEIVYSLIPIATT